MSDSSEATAAAAEAAEDKQELDYNQKVRQMAEKGIYEFEYVEGDKTGQKIRLDRRKISNRMMLELEEDRAEYGALISELNNGKMSKEDRRKAAKTLTDLYAKLAKYYFHIEREDFDLMDWDSTKPNIDAAANVSIRGRPNLV